MVVRPNVPALPVCVNDAVYVVFVAGGVTLWVCAPLSGQLLKAYAPLPLVCGGGALIVLLEPMTTVVVNGAAAAVPFIASCAPVGELASVRFTVCGSRRTLVVAVAPPESVAVSWISSQHGY